MNPDGFDLGARLKEIRESKGLSQRELARRANVTNGTISLIEKNRNSPSVSSLKRVLDAIPIDLGEFFAIEKTAKDKVFFGFEELPLLVDGDISFRVVGDNSKSNAMHILHENYAPGADTGETMLSHEAQEGGIIIEGEIEVTVGKQVRTLGPGESYYFDSRTPHRFRNLSDKNCTIVSACTPPYL